MSRASLLVGPNPLVPEQRSFCKLDRAHVERETNRKMTDEYSKRASGQRGKDNCGIEPLSIFTPFVGLIRTSASSHIPSVWSSMLGTTRT